VIGLGDREMSLACKHRPVSVRAYWREQCFQLCSSKVHSHCLENDEHCLGRREDVAFLDVQFECTTRLVTSIRLDAVRGEHNCNGVRPVRKSKKVCS